MKKVCTRIVLALAIAIMSHTYAFSQVPQGLKYQAVVRDYQGKVRTNQLIALTIRIMQGNPQTGTEVFFEPHAPIADDMGFISVVIGKNNVIDFKQIDWSQGPYYLVVSIDNVEMGATELLSVPYALYAEKSKQAQSANVANSALSIDYAHIQNLPNWSDTIAKISAQNLAYSNEQTDSLLQLKADKNLVYTIHQIDSLFVHKIAEASEFTDAILETKFNVIDASISQIETTITALTGVDAVYDKTTVDALLDFKADKISVYTKVESNVLHAAKADTATVYSRTKIDNMLSQKANTTSLAPVALSNNYQDLLQKPTKLSDFVNDVPFATQSMVLSEADVNNLILEKNYISVETDPIFMVSPAYTISASHITTWNAKSDFDGAYASLSGKPDLSVYALNTQVYSKLESDAALSLKANVADLSQAAYTGNYSDLQGVPTKLSDFTNDMNFADASEILTSSQILDIVHTNGYIKNSQELDPLFSVSPASTISNASITYWNAKSDFDGAYGSLTGTPDLSIYAPLSYVYSQSEINTALAGKANTVDLSSVAFSNNYLDLSNKPSKLSQFSNDLNYVTESQMLTESQILSMVLNDGFIKNATELDPVFTASPAYGITSVKMAYWDAKSDFDGAYASLTGKPDLTVYALSSNVYSKTEANTLLSEKANQIDLKPVAFSGNYNDLLFKPIIPTSLSQLTNDADFITSADVITLSDVETQILSKNYITNAGEIDPVFSASIAKNITLTDISSWNAKSDFDGAYASLTGKPDLSQFAYASQVYSQAEVDALLTTKVSSSALASVAISGDYGDLLNRPTSLSLFTNDAGYITTVDLLDNSATNELQTLSLSGNTLTISSAGGNSIVFENWDTDVTNDVTIEGTQTITGDKTFSGAISVPTPTLPSHAATKAYVDALEQQVSVLQSQVQTQNSQIAMLNQIMLQADMYATLTDIDNNVYKIKKIGNQIWMAENLKTTKYNDGEAISYPGTNNTLWSSTTLGAYAWYNNNSTNKDVHGALYNWHAVASSKLCPQGWHVPTDDEWKALEMYVGMSSIEADLTDFRGVDEASKLKSVDVWAVDGYEVPGTNTSGFTAIASGERMSTGTFQNGSDDLFGTSFWTSTARYYRSLFYDNAQIYRENNPSTQMGYSVRCVKD